MPNSKKKLGKQEVHIEELQVLQPTPIKLEQETHELPLRAKLPPH